MSEEKSILNCFGNKCRYINFWNLFKWFIIILLADQYLSCRIYNFCLQKSHRICNFLLTENHKICFFLVQNFDRCVLFNTFLKYHCYFTTFFILFNHHPYPSSASEAPIRLLDIDEDGVLDIIVGGANGSCYKRAIQAVLKDESSPGLWQKNHKTAPGPYKKSQTEAQNKVLQDLLQKHHKKPRKRREWKTVPLTVFYCGPYICLDYF